jgi:signal peptidase I
MRQLEYIPFLNFTGEVEQTHNGTFLLKQMSQALGKIIRQGSGQLAGQIFNGKEWINDDPLAAIKPHTSVQTYSDFWGIRNFAMVQLLTKEQVTAQSDSDTSGLGNATLYLELRHTPNLTNPAPKFFNQAYGTTLMLTPLRTYIPLESRHLNALMDAVYTARFVVEGGKVRRYSPTAEPPLSGGWRLEEVPDGTYEFYHGKAYQIGWGGIAYELPPESPLYNRSLPMIQQLFNLGIDLHPAFTPHRYAYFRQGDLYLMGTPILKKGDPALEAFHKREQDKQKRASKEHPYIAFRDPGPPLLTNGQVDTTFIKAFGLHIPPKHYLALGDNHAMSGDSRIWGFVPEANIQGAPSFIFWPPGPRFGAAQNQPILPWITTPHIIIWILITLIGGGTLLWYYRKRQQPIFKKI